MKRLVNKLPNSIKLMAVYGSGLVLMKMTSLLMVPIFTNFLDPADYGRLDVLQTLANLFSIVIAFGLSQSLFRFAGEDTETSDRKRTAAEIFGLAIIIAIVSAVVSQAFAPFISRMMPGDVTETQVRLILGSLALSGLILVPMSWLRMRDRAFGYFLASAGCAVVQAGFTAVLLYMGYGIEGVLFSGLVCMSVVAVMLFIVQARDTGIRLNISAYPRYSHFGGVLVFAGIAAFVMDSFPRWILAGHAGPAEMAIFALAAKLAMIASFLTQPFEMWWMPKRFTVLLKPDGLQACARATEAGIVTAMSAAILVGAVAPAVITIMTPVAYHGAMIYVPGLAVLIAMNASVRLINIGCLSKERTVWPLIIDGVAASTACIGYFLAIPVWGAWGIVAVTAVALVGRIAAYIIIGARIRAIPYAYGRLGLLTAMTIGASIALTFVSDVYGNLGFGLCALAVLLVSAFALGVIPKPASLQSQEMSHVPAP